ncbi:MAG: phosphoribosyltransferase [Gemmatimonadaceae bacterium]
MQHSNLVGLAARSRRLARKHNFRGSHHSQLIAMPRTPQDASKGTFIVDWPLFGELSRALALKVARAYELDLVLGIAPAGVIPGATVAAVLDREFYSIIVSRRYRADTVRATPAVLGRAPPEVRDRRVLVVDETCESGDTLRLAVAAAVNGGAREIRTAVSFKTGKHEPDFYALETESVIVLPWDREVLVGGELVPNPKYADTA